MTVPGLIYERIKDTFPSKVQESVLTVQLPADASGASGFMPQLQPESRMRFVRQDEGAFVQLRSHLLAINCLQPYPSWERFLPLIQKTFSAYQDVAQPTGIHRIGLRYINRIPIPSEMTRASQYFTLYPETSPQLPMFGGFSMRLLFPYEEGRDVLKIELASSSDETGEAFNAFLDLDYFLTRPSTVEPQQALDWVVQAHDAIEHAFEACITDELRSQFDLEHNV